MNVRTTFARLACAATFLLAALAANAAPAGNVFASPAPVPAGGVTRLYFTFFDDAGLAFNGGTFSMLYPAGVVNVGGVVFDSCGTTVASPGASGFSSTNITVVPSSSCNIYVDVIASIAGTQTITLPAGSFAASSGVNAADITASFVVVAPITRQAVIPATPA